MKVPIHAPYLVMARWCLRTLSRRSRLERGMAYWRDMLDWLGGYPFEVARPEQVLEALLPKGFVLQKVKTCGGRHGCNEIVFAKSR